MAIYPGVTEDAASDGDTAAATARLETALERIAVLAARPAGVSAGAGPAADSNAAAIAGRLDALIASLTEELAGDSQS